MAKFAAVEQAKMGKQVKQDEHAQPGNSGEPELTEEELQEALKVDHFDVPIDPPIEERAAPQRRGALVERLGARRNDGAAYEPLDDYVPCEVRLPPSLCVYSGVQHPSKHRVWLAVAAKSLSPITHTQLSLGTLDHTHSPPRHS
jgi:hypothetical protein